jgi:hypothetical protein
VLDVNGVWLVEAATPKKLSGGDRLSAGATFYPQQSGPETYIVVCLYTGVAKTYKSKTTLSTRVEPALLSRIWTAVHGHYRGGVVHAISRGEDLADGVGKITPQGIDVGPLVEKLPAGPQLLRITARKAADSPDAKPAPIIVTVAVDPTTKQTLAAGEMTPGLYKVELLDKRTRQPVGSEAVMLTCDSETHERTSAAFVAATASLKDWDDQARESGAGPFLQAYLEALADDAKQSGDTK